MLRNLILAALAALAEGCGGSISDPLREVVACEIGDGQCERACANSNEPLTGSCIGRHPDYTTTLNCGGEADLEEFEGSSGCCFPQDGVQRWFECEGQ